jgi:hypothetical protein
MNEVVSRADIANLDEVDITFNLSGLGVDIID